MQLAGTRRFYLLDPRAEDVYLEDIADHLSKLCRYTGGCQGFYSVAEHSVLCSLAAPIGYELEALLHDGHEAYVGDLSRPLKYALREASLCRRSSYDEVEQGVDLAVRERFGLPAEMAEEVRQVDVRITANEREALFPASCADDWWPEGKRPEPLGVRIRRWEPAQARTVFYNRYLQLTAEG